MSGEGPTVVGSIVGKLKLDISDWLDKIAVAKAASHELSDSDPNIRVHVDSAAALAALERVKLKTDELAASNAGLSAANRAVANSTNAASGAQDGMGLRTKVLVAAIALLIPMLGPLTGYAAGVAGALGLMGVAGVIAVLGIKNAMAQGTAVGDAYSVALGNLKTNFRELETSAATGLLSSFNAMVATIDSNMPMLNIQMNMFAHMLGGTVSSVLIGAMNILRVLNPLFVQAGVYVEQLAQGFEKWTQSDGLQQFGNYAQNMLPMVANDLGNLVQGLLHLVEALTPLGNVVLGTLGLLGTILNAIPTQVLFGLVTVVGLVLLGFKLWSVIPGIIDAVETGLLKLMYASDALGGPIGLLVLGVSALVAVFMFATTVTEAQTKAQDSYTTAVQASNGVIDEGVKLQAAKNLQDAGALTAATALGIKTDQLVQAALGNNTAQKQVNDTLDNQRHKVDAAAESFRGIARSGLGPAGQAMGALRQNVDTVTTSLATQQGGLKAALKAYNELAKSQDQDTISTRAQLQAAVDLAAKYGGTVSAWLTAKAANEKAAASLKATTLAMQLQNDAAGLLTNALALMNGKGLSLAQAQTGMRASTNALTDSLKTNKSAIDGGSKAAVANQQAIQNVVQSAQNLYVATGKATGSTKEATTAYYSARDGLLAQLKAAGQLTPAIQAYITKLFGIPKVVSTQIDINTATALAKLKAVAQGIAAVNGHISYGGPTPSGQVGAHGGAHGGPIPHFGDGGPISGPSSPVGDQVPIMASPDEYMINAASANRYSSLISAINTGTSKQVQKEAEAVAGPDSSMGGGDTQVVIVNKTGVTLDDLIEVHIKKNNQTQRVNIGTGQQRASR